MEPKPIASLSSVLLARKGAARPAMRRPMTGSMGGAAAMTHDDLGWNDMGYDVDPDPSTPMDYEHDSGYNSLANAVPEVRPEVRQQQDRIAEQLNVQAEAFNDKPVVVEQLCAIEQPQAEVIPISAKAVVRAPRQAAGLKAKSAFTLRLDAERHLKLRLACAVSHRSAQMLVTEALDSFIAAMPQVDQLASQLPAPKHAQHD